MATTSFTIYSRYNSEKDKERLQLETGQIHVDGGGNKSGDEWLWREAASAQFLRAQRPPPKFVPATLYYEIGSSELGFSKPYTPPRERRLGSSLSSWYRSLTKASSTEAKSHQPCPDSIPVPALSSSAVRAGESSMNQTQDKNNWFIQKVLQSESPLNAPSTLPPTPTLPDILAREPPPLPSGPRYVPPVWTEIGPSNKGFVMLQRGGWNEGEALGFNARRNFSTGFDSSSNSDQELRETESMEGTIDRVQRIPRREFCDSFGDIKKERQEIIDLTLSSDSEESLERDQEEEEEDGDVKVENLMKHSEGFECPLKSREGDSEDINILAHGRKALLTPIGTVLKLDRLGIGLKVKTEGPYKASVKRVTHNAISLAAHVRMAEKARRRREVFGRGIKGYERQRRKEEEKRRHLLAYMNS